jgi:hypothetical protein
MTTARPSGPGCFSPAPLTPEEIDVDGYVVRDGRARIVTVAPWDVVWLYLLECCPGGEYGVEGPDTDCTVIRKDATIYPSSGTVGGIGIAPRNLVPAGLVPGRQSDGRPASGRRCQLKTRKPGSQAEPTSRSC